VNRPRAEFLCRVGPLTDVLIRKQPLPEKLCEMPDGKIAGLYLVVQPSGAKSFALRYRVDRLPRMLTLGTYPALDLATARKRTQGASATSPAAKTPPL
jgi:hypothetical protein